MSKKEKHKSQVQKLMLSKDFSRKARPPSVSIEQEFGADPELDELSSDQFPPSNP
jgi:hypothetical protein